MRQAGALAGGWELLFPRYTPAQLYELVADIESYPRFVPGCVATRVIARAATEWRVDNLFGFGPVRSRFSSLTRADAPHRLEVRSSDGPWKSFHLVWQLDPAAAGCRLGCSFAVEFISPALATLAAFGMPEMERRIIAAFEKRAEALYG